MPDGAPAGPTRNPAGAVLVGAGLPALVAAALLAALGALAGPSAAASCLLGSGLAMWSLAMGPFLMLLARNMDPPAVMGAALGGYSTAIGTAGLVFLAAEPQQWVQGSYTGWSLLVTLIAWVAGQVRATSRLRVLVYDEVAEGGAPADGPARRVP